MIDILFPYSFLLKYIGDIVNIACLPLLEYISTTTKNSFVCVYLKICIIRLLLSSRRILVRLSIVEKNHHLL